MVKPGLFFLYYVSKLNKCDVRRRKIEIPIKNRCWTIGTLRNNGPDVAMLTIYWLYKNAENDVKRL